MLFQNLKSDFKTDVYIPRYEVSKVDDTVGEVFFCRFLPFGYVIRLGGYKVAMKQRVEAVR